MIAPLVCWLLAGISDQADIAAKLKNGTGDVELPTGVTEVSSEIEIPFGAHDLTIHGAKAGTVLRATTSFTGRAIFSSRGATKIHFENFEIEGNRAALNKPQGLAPSDVPFAKWTRNNGILLESATDATIANVKMREISGFAVLISASKTLVVKSLDVRDSGSYNAKGRNNSTGGILLEEGTADFQVLDSTITNVSGNGIWTHSLYKSERNTRGRIAGNTISDVARDAVQIGHSTDIVVEENTGGHVGYPLKFVDVENGGVPAALDTAGNTEKSTYLNNHFAEVNGKCIDLDGFHDGEVRGNICENHDVASNYPFGNFGIVMNNSNPDMQSRNVTITENTIDGALFGGIFVIGTANRITRNHLLNLNLAHCPEGAKEFGCFLGKNEPDILRTGIYLGKGAERPDPSRANSVEDNEITGYEMGRNCIHVAPGVSLDRNTVRRNRCSDDAPINARNRVDQLSIGRISRIVEE